MMMSFHLGDAESYRWTVTSNEIRITVLPNAAVLNDLAVRFRHAVEIRDPAARTYGQRLSSELLKDLPQRTPGHWLLALSGRLLEAPLAALVVGPENGPRYLIEDKVLEVVPGAWAIGENNPYLRKLRSELATPSTISRIRVLQNKPRWRP